MLVVKSANFDFGRQPILRNITLHCERGEIVGVVGRSGVGKSTLLNLICGLLPLQSGVISIDGVAPLRAAHSQEIGYVFQTPTLLPWLSIRENTALPLLLRRKNPIRNILGKFLSGEQFDVEVLEATRSALSRSHIADAAAKTPGELSGGMQTRASIARAIVYEPKVLLLDEPFASLDDLVKERLYLELQEVASSVGCATVLVTHNLTEALVLCDRIYVLKKTKDGSASVARCEDVAFEKPRSLEVIGHPDFLKSRRALRENLE